MDQSAQNAAHRVKKAFALRARLDRRVGRDSRRRGGGGTGYSTIRR